MSELAVQGCQVSITSGQSAVSIQVTTQPSDKVFAENKGVYFGDIDVSLVTITVGNLVCAGGTITISGTADNVLNADGYKAVQKGDSGSAELTFKDSSSGTETKLEVKIEVTDAGQGKVIAL